VKYLSNILFNLFVFYFLIVNLTGCNNDRFDQVKEMIAAYNFTSALDMLSNMNDSDMNEVRFHRLRALALFVEGDMEAGFLELSQVEPELENEPKSRLESGRILFEAAEVIIREKNRVNESIALLDSAITCDPGIKNEVMQLAWQRTIEYIAVPGDVGYRLLQFAVRHDPKVLGRLRGFNRSYMKRYEEMQTVEMQLYKLYDIFINYRNKHKRNPLSLQDMVQNKTISQRDTSRTGWHFRLESINDTIRVVAEALPRHPADVQMSTIMHVP